MQRQRLAEFDLSARRQAQALSETYTLNLDVLMPAIGQMPDLAWNAGSAVDATRSRTLVVDEAFATNMTGVFAAGDAVSGPATIVQAVAHGNLVAVAVDEWVRLGRKARPKYITPRHDVGGEAPAEGTKRRPETPRISVAERVDNFREIEPGFDEETARAEAGRCLRCDLDWLDVMGIPRPGKEKPACVEKEI